MEVELKVEIQEVKGHVREEFDNGLRDDHGRIYEFTNLQRTYMSSMHGWKGRERSHSMK